MDALPELLTTGKNVARPRRREKQFDKMVLINCAGLRYPMFGQHAWIPLPAVATPSQPFLMRRQGWLA
jgi:hypothetical protein